MARINVYYDDDCGICNKLKQFAEHNSDRLDFYSINDLEKIGNVSIVKLIKETNFSTLIVEKENTLLIRAEAVFALAQYLNFPYNLISFGSVFPLFLSNFIYRYFARNRHIIGCTLPQ